MQGTHGGYRSITMRQGRAPTAGTAPSPWAEHHLPYHCVGLTTPPGTGHCSAERPQPKVTSLPKPLCVGYTPFGHQHSTPTLAPPQPGECLGCSNHYPATASAAQTPSTPRFIRNTNQAVETALPTSPASLMLLCMWQRPIATAKIMPSFCNEHLCILCKRFACHQQPQRKRKMFELTKYYCDLLPDSMEAIILSE